MKQGRTLKALKALLTGNYKSYGDTVCYLDGKDFAYWPSMNGSLLGSAPRRSGGAFTTMEAEHAKEQQFQSLLPEITKGMRDAFNNK